MPQVGEASRNRWTMFVADQAMTGGMSASISRWRGNRTAPCRFQSGKNLPKLIGGMIAIGMTKLEINHRFNIPPEQSRQFWLAFLELPESEQVETFRWADRLGKQARFRIGDL
jgi:hypothetical protein